AQAGGNVAGNARKEIELKTGKKVISKTNAKSIINNNNKLNN
ncbi:MAG: hypothetical protein COX80_04385, partial [Candidatus Magasanikbacteria bacterium CG_4_10_14_0_2_um_filter_33_14]